MSAGGVIGPRGSLPHGPTGTISAGAACGIWIFDLGAREHLDLLEIEVRGVRTKFHLPSLAQCINFCHSISPSRELTGYDLGLDDFASYRIPD